ncbi:4a-hydroxytetrahydrobiopterin dehydratase [Gordonia crocea]|uniref:Putative pterin-4-alpha-carbinolamine dehydratase n=1 Tax=Gordonia crocea TaxID=589162 RepID=A0A7I9UX41_9ACTN|nr:4a-hydroxytetrahydrobiopterin dehydratase [Gordonia crocea]GED97774.1 putative pterin-4-alpha-carbinolamine dehydratase [Gordonia crocea]
MVEHHYRPLSAAAAEQAVPAPWRVVDDSLVARYRTGTMVRGLEFVTRIVAAAEAADHHPDIGLRYGTVALAVTTHAVGGLTDADTALAAAIDQIARELGIGAN